MKSSRPGLLVVTLVLLASCSRLPTALHREIADENARLHEAQEHLQQSQQELNKVLSENAALFQDLTQPAEWRARLRSDQQQLDSAARLQAELDGLARRNRSDSQPRVEQALREERQLLHEERDDSQAVVAIETKWLNFAHALPSHLDALRQEQTEIADFDLAPVTKYIDKADRDWPSKKPVLDARLDGLRKIPKQAETQWDESAAARTAAAGGKVDGPQLATLVATDDDLARDLHSLRAQSNELENLSGQLYDSWDKVLTDLDVERRDPERVYRERIKTIRTHYTDVASKQSETTVSQQWIDVSGPQFHAVENDLGMAIAHKDAGLFDSEANATPEPAGFAYMAPESQGRNQYGYWDHSHGQSIWTWLPEYLILRDLLWNHDYRPVVLDDYRGYRTAERAGHTYYGQASPTAPPKYGTQGTFTQTHYANSRYVQSGGFRGSAYSSHSGGIASAPHSAPRSEPGFNNDTAGHRFGSGAHAPSGHRFGRGGFGGGRRFGRR